MIRLETGNDFRPSTTVRNAGEDYLAMAKVCSPEDTCPELNIFLRLANETAAGRSKII
jgi:hypothetical protein